MHKLASFEFLSPLSDVVVRGRSAHQRLVVLGHLVVLRVVGRRRGVLRRGRRGPGMETGLGHQILKT